MNNMTAAIHIHSTKPFFMKTKGVPFFMEDYNLLSTILSALMWREKNGTIKLYTDKIGYDYYGSLGLFDLWDAGIDTDVLEGIPKTINQQIFWAAAKIFALQNAETPVAMIDMDLIVWKDIASELTGKQFSVIHRESLIGYYPSPNKLKIRAGYQFDPEWDWTVLPCNMAFAYFSDADFKNYFTGCAIDFMIDNGEYPMEFVSQMVFAEQRMAALCAKKMNVPIHHFLDDPWQNNNKHFTHIWGGKDIARNNPMQRKLLCCALLKKIEVLFPVYYEKLYKIEMFEKFLSQEAQFA
jgi:hypothetical protein